MPKEPDLHAFDDLAFPPTPFDYTLDELVAIKVAIDRNTAALERLITLLTPKAKGAKA